MTESLRSTAITTASSLLRILPNLNFASLLSSLSCQRLDFSLIIIVQISPVPHKSPYHAPVTYTPTAIQPISRHPSDLSQLWLKHLVLTAKNGLTTLRGLFTFVQLHGTYLTATTAFSISAQYHNFLIAAPNGGLKPAPECRFRGTYPHLLQSIFRLLCIPPLCSLSFRTHLA
jgi:hypothetical protein